MLNTIIKLSLSQQQQKTKKKEKSSNNDDSRTRLYMYMFASLTFHNVFRRVFAILCIENLQEFLCK